MPSDMDADETQLRERFEQSSNSELERIKTIHGVGSREGRVANQILVERRQELRRSARIIAWATVVTAGASVAAAFAGWTAIFFQHHQIHTAPNDSRQAAASITPSSLP